ncbi:MAG: hypothetical protein COY40_02520 [Alphaproteobacteria bacterium CG_4_10_14_0_8_um_filter_53_9]|nr:MAG: hypothetical protein COY40_02520 [Alphaproteobacteria bacterium CG_4_10_14_0_8_um_filter_53_9]
MDLLTTSYILRMAGALLFTLALMLGGVYLLQNTQDKLRRRTGISSKRLKKLESLALTRTTSVHLIEADNTAHLVITDATGTTLHPLDKSSEPLKNTGPTITKRPK